MRIIHGDLSGRRLTIPKNIKARPTTDLARESLFNILINRLNFYDLKVLDLFSGTGAISYEFASLGCQDIVCIDNNYKHISIIKKNSDILGLQSITAIKADALKYITLAGRKFNVIFADPPYDHPNLEEIPSLIQESDLLENDGLLIIEHGPTTNFTNTMGLKELRKYGKVHFSFFRF